MPMPMPTPDLSPADTGSQYAGLNPTERVAAMADAHMSTCDEPTIDDCAACRNVLGVIRRVVAVVEPVIREDGLRTGWRNAGLFVRDDPAAIRAYARQAGFDALTDAEAEFAGRIVARVRMGLQYAAGDGSVAALPGRDDSGPEQAG